MRVYGRGKPKGKLGWKSARSGQSVRTVRKRNPCSEENPVSSRLLLRNQTTAAESDPAFLLPSYGL